ncbi:MAG: ATP-binding cassette domain-containing protein [Alphaproteobacteria bacterium]|nr:ATP-binding cassette domain-containing protein [Alphaproteobacteria bacterium]
MSSSIALKNLSWATPDGQHLFTDLNLSFGPGRTGLIGNNGTGKSTLLKLIDGSLSPSGGSISRVGRVAMMRQLAQIDDSQTLADIFGMRDALACLDRIERGSPTDDDLDKADWSLTARYHDTLAQVALTAMDPDRPFTELSGGEKTRALLAALLFSAPDVILLDEPTNNLDEDGRAAIADIVTGWRGPAIIVSHDRSLLERMDHIVELTSLGAQSYGGNWSDYCARKAIDLQATEHRRDVAEQTVRDIDRRAQARQEQKQKRDAAGKRKRARGDQPKILLDGMKERAQRTSSANARLADRQRRVAAQQATDARAQIETLQPLSMSLNSSGLANGKTIVDVRELTGGHPGTGPIIQDLSLTLTGPERVAITGANGAGKSTLLHLLSGRVPPISGSARINGHAVILDQHMDLLDPALSIRDNFRRLNPDADENACRSALARFQFRADAALQAVGSLSGGEMLRAGLAAVLGGPRPPQLLMLDEPTNHLDLRSIEALEAALTAYDGALLVISHDETFLQKIGIERRIHLEGDR